MQWIKTEVYIPEEFLPILRDTLNNGEFLRNGCYDNVLASQKVTGYWRPLEGANPFNGEIGELTTAEEIKVEFRCRLEDRREVERIIRSVHPYEVPVINFIPLLE